MIYRLFVDNSSVASRFATPSMYNKTTRSANTGRPRGADYVVVVVGAAISIVTPCVGLRGSTPGVQSWLQCMK